MARRLRSTVFREIFGAFIDRTEPEHEFFHLRLPDGGEADAYVGPSGPGRAHADRVLWMKRW